MNRAVQSLDSHPAQGNIELFRRSSLVVLSIWLLGSGVPHCAAQQSQTVQASASADMERFQQLENRWSQAIGKRDQYALELVLSPDLVDVSETGDVTTRNQQIAMLVKKDGGPLSVDQRVLSVRIFGNVAVVVGTYFEMRDIRGKRASRNGMFIHVYLNARGNWLCINAQRTAITEAALQKRHGEKSK